MVQSKEYYKEVVRDYIKQHHPRFLTEMTKEDLEEMIEDKVDYFLRAMAFSSNPQDEKEVYYKDMLTF